VSDERPRVVFDAVVFVQALISGRGPAAACIERAKYGQAILFMSDEVLAEVNNVPRRPELTRRYSQLTPERIDMFVEDVRKFAVHLNRPPKVFSLPRDPKDEPYTNLAVAANAKYLVTWNDRHLTYLMRKDTEEGESFCRQFPFLNILTPPEFLKAIGTAGREEG